ncbi:ankyrin repeat-containing domain protein [Amylocarpus encephaloides]|uniref:Ankyrin repeat-containing domain protein n=1 Tax=Amylocarpus encephaloides TaxID=45428 RepID=A0A9P7Y5J9_9HELO|nr:ankyrin repeat-containing domain protein [Amylocarpus encephaloides]
MGWIELIQMIPKLEGIINYFSNAPNSFGTLLAAAMFGAQADLVVFLIKHGASAQSHSGAKGSFFEGFNPLHFLFLLEERDINSIANLLVAHGADPNGLMESAPAISTFLVPHFPLHVCGSPLDVATRHGNFTAVKPLLDHGADPLRVCPATSIMTIRQPLHVAVALLQFEIVGDILEHLKGGDKELLGGRSMILTWLLTGPNWKCAAIKTLEVCILHGLSIDDRDELGRTPLMWSCMRG